MRFFEFRDIERRPLNESARIQHAEDIVFWEGSSGAIRALEALRNLEQGGHENVTIKWDGCVHPDTLVQTKQGLLRIEEVIDRYKNNEEFSVLQHDFKTSKDCYAPITNAVKKYGHKQWVEVELENNEKLTLTEDHEVYTTNRGWVEAGKLTEDDDIQQINKQD